MGYDTDGFTGPTAPDVSEHGELKAAQGSGLAQLRGRRAKAVEKLSVDLPVQRSEELLGARVIVRFRTFTYAEMEGIRKRFARYKVDDHDVIVNASILALSCLGVFTESERDDPSAWMRFDAELAALILDVDEDEAKLVAKGAVDVVRLLYFTDGDVVSTATKVADFSGFSLEGLEEDNSGN